MGRGRKVVAGVLALGVLVGVLALTGAAQAQEAEGAGEGVGPEEQVGAADTVELAVTSPGGETSGDDVSGDACTGGTGRTVSGTVRGTNDRRVHVNLGISYLDSAGNSLNDGNGGYWGDILDVGHGISLEGEEGVPLTFSFPNVPANACSFWIEVYPRDAQHQTDRTYYGGGLIRNRQLTAGGSTGNNIYLPVTCGVGGGEAGDPTHTTTGDVTAMAYVNGTPRGINRLSYWSLSTPVSPGGRAYGFGVESPTTARTPLTASSMAANQSYNLRVQIPSTGSTNLAHLVPSVPVYPCQETFVHVTWTPFGVVTQFGRFRDVSTGNPFYADILWMADNEITTGYTDGTYRPVSIVTRQAMSAFMYRLAGEPPFDAPGTPSFTDVGPSNQFYDEIEWMAAEEISTGYDDHTYRPSWQVTRGAMSAFMYRLAGEPEFVDPVTPSFSDVAPDFAFYSEIEWMNAEEITTGHGDGTYRAGAGVSRQAMSAFMHRLAPLL
jgi:hypothetical protein